MLNNVVQNNCFDLVSDLISAIVDQLKEQFSSPVNLSTVASNFTSIVLSAYAKFDQNQNPGFEDFAPALISCLSTYLVIRDACNTVTRNIPKNYHGDGRETNDNPNVAPARLALAKEKITRLKNTQHMAQCIEFLTASIMTGIYAALLFKPSTALRILAFIMDAAVALTQICVSNNTLADLQNMSNNSYRAFYSNEPTILALHRRLSFFSRQSQETHSVHVRPTSFGDV